MNWRLPKDRIWPTLIVAVLVIYVGVGIVMMRLASNDPNFAVEPDYYAKAMAWDSTTAQAARNASLGWQLTPLLGKVATGREAELTLRVQDRSGAPIRGASVHIQAMSVAHASEVINASLKEASTGGNYSADLPMSRSGAWEVRVVATRGAESFTANLRIDLSHETDAAVIPGHPWDADPARVRAGMRRESTARPGSR